MGRRALHPPLRGLEVIYMYYDYEDKRYHEGEPPAEMTPPVREPVYPASNWSEPVYRAADEHTSYSPGYSNNATGYNAYNSRSQSQSWEGADTHKKKKKRGGRGFVRALCLVLVCAIVSGAVGYGAATYTIKNSSKSGRLNQVVLGSVSSVGAKQENSSGSVLTTPGNDMSGDDIYALACEQVVGIQTAGNAAVNIFGQTTMTPAVSGSGFVISADGYIATNYHVIEYALLYGEQYGYAVTVIMHDGTSYAAEIIGSDKDNDIAVLKIEATGLNAVTFGSSADMRVGNMVYAVGNPLGELEYTMTSGIVSALDREITTEKSVAVNMFQIDAAINSGNSGGPVYDAQGRVIGIVTAKYSQSGVEGLGFAIPIDDAVKYISDIIEHGYVTGKAYLGVMVETLSGTAIKYYNLPEGAYIDEIIAGYCAEKAGLQAGDIITAVGGETVTSREMLKSVLRSYSVGDTAAVTVYRNGQYYDFTVTFDEAPKSDSTTTQQQQQPYFGNFGFFGN